VLAVFAAAAFLRFYKLDSLPLGFHHDEGLDATAALEIWTKGQRPIFFPQSGSREPLMIYLESLGILALGATRLGARIMQACVGTAGVLAAWFLVRDMLGRRVALLAAACTAVSFWQMFESRLGLRAISQPLFETLGLLFFWRTLTRRSWLDAVLAGLFLGLTTYTYTASRALPILLVLIVLWRLATSPALVLKEWRRIGTVAVLMLAVFAPLGVYAVTHPQEFFGRSLQVNVLNPEPFTGSAEAGGVGGSVLHTLGMFSVQGDPEWKYNIGGLPVFDWPMSVLFYAGIVLAVLGAVRAFRARAPADPDGFLLLWLVVMLLPGFLSSEAPHFLRTIGIIPAVFVFPALALDWGIQRWRWAVPVAGLVLLGEGAETGYRYFQEWGHSAMAYYAMQADAADVADFLRQQPGSEPVLFSSQYPGHPSVLYLAPKQFPDIRWFDGRQGMAFPGSGQPYLYVFSAHYQPPFLDLSRLFRPDQLVQEGHDPEGGVSYRIYRGAPVSPAPPIPLKATVGDLAQIEGVALPASAQAGTSIDVQEYFHTLKQDTPDLRAFLHLVDAQGNLWAQADNLGYYAEDWQPGDAAINSQTLQLPAYAPPVPMTLLFGFYRPSTGQQLPIRDAAGQAAGTELKIGAILVQPGGAPAAGWQPPHPLNAQVAPGLTLAGWNAPQTSVRAGESIPVDLFWRVSSPVSAAPALQLGDTAVRQAGLADLLPPAQWPLGVVEDRRKLTVNPTASAGAATLSIDGVTLTSLTISQPPRDFALPAVQRQLDLPVGSFATLAGLSVDAHQPGQPLQVTLVWQDRTTTSSSYKVFVHVLDAHEKVVAQRDDFPQGGSMPTTSWVPGQVIADRYQVPLPDALPDGAQLEIGMYDPASGKRLAIGPADNLRLPLNR